MTSHVALNVLCLIAKFSNSLRANSDANRD